MHLQQSINQLTDTIRPPAASIKYLSLFLDLTQKNTSQRQTQLNSLFSQEAPQQIKEKLEPHIHNHLTKKPGRGFAYFYAHHKDKDISSKQAIPIHLSKPPTSQAFYSDIYRLTPLMHALQQETRAIIVTLNHQQTSIYALNHELKHIHNLENPYTFNQPSEYLEKYRPQTDQQVVQSSGEANTQRRLETATKWHLNDLVTKLTQLIKPPYHTVVVFHSHKFATLSQGLKQHPKLQQYQVHTSDQNYSSIQDLDQAARQHIRQIQQQQHQQAYTQAKDGEQPFVQGFEQVIPALRKKQVDTLFTPLDQTATAYISNQLQPYTSQAPHTTATENCIDWLVAITLKQEANVVVHTDDKPIAAQLYYHP